MNYRKPNPNRDDRFNPQRQRHPLQDYDQEEEQEEDYRAPTDYYNRGGMQGRMMPGFGQGYGQGYGQPVGMPMMPNYFMPMMMAPNMMPMNDPQMMNQMMGGGYNPYDAGSQFLQRNYSQQEFNTHNTREDDQFISLKKKNNRKMHPNYHSTQRPNQPEVDEDIEKVYSKPQRKLWRFEDFKQQTLPRLQLRKIVKIQALIRGAYVRKKKWPQILFWHQGSVRFTDSVIDHYIEDVFIPDLVLEILTKNRIYENIDLYSDENKILYQIRQDMIEKVVRDMAKQTLKQTTNQVVNEYLSKRFKTKTIEEQDPLRGVVANMIDKAMKGIVRDIARTQLNGVVFDYLIEAQFIGFFNNYYIRREVQHTVKDALEDIAVGEVIEDYIERVLREAVPVIGQGEHQNAVKIQDKEEVGYAFNEYIDRCLLELTIENLSKIYEEEEREVHFREQTDKKRRDELRSKSQQAKTDDLEYDRAASSRQGRQESSQGAAQDQLQPGSTNARDKFTASMGNSLNHNPLNVSADKGGLNDSRGGSAFSQSQKKSRSSASNQN